MIIYSEKTKKTYPTVDACAEAEAAYDAKIAEEKRIAEEKEQARKVREAEVAEAYEALAKAEKRYNELVEAYNHDYGYPTFCECEGCEGCDFCEDEEEDDCECECGCCGGCCDEDDHMPMMELRPEEILAALFFGAIR